MTSRDDSPPDATAATAPDDRAGRLASDGGDDDLVLAPPGYAIGELLGRGGMGEVLLAHDQRIGRDVAIKRMRETAPTGDDVRRFLREAKIQARLDHPAIAPVHELGLDADGRPYFAMKRLAGVTLHDRLYDETVQLSRLLRAFADVCLAVQFAHERGVIHRDLKPANIMLGDYGEVYILDWGVARVVTSAPRDSVADIGTLDGHTDAGSLLGTPGYMAPEQARGENVAAAADVYSLGAILFEILTRQTLHPRGGAAIEHTLATPTVSPGVRDPEHAPAPELDAACVAALAEDPRARPTARELGERLQRYLDGDRDLEARRAIAGEQLVVARAAIASADPLRRAEAIRAAGRALALEPSSPEAAALVGSLMLEPPRELPPALAGHLEELDRDLGARSSHFAAMALCAYFLFIPLLALDGIKAPGLVIFAYVMIGAQAVYAEWMYRTRRPHVIPVLVLNLALMIVMSRLWGPLILVPGIINTVAVTVGAQPKAIDRPLIIVIGSVSAFLVPIALEAFGVFDSTWGVGNDQLTITSPSVELGNAWSVVLLVAGNAVLVIVNALFARSIALTRRDAQRDLAIQAWHLRQLLPT